MTLAPRQTYLSLPLSSPSPDPVAIVGSIVYSPQRMTTPRETWVDVLTSVIGQLALSDLLLIDGPGQKVLGSIVDLQFVEEKSGTRPPEKQGQTSPTTREPIALARRAYAKLAILASSDGRQQKLPQGTRVRYPTPTEVTDLLMRASAIPPEARIPAGVITTQSGYAPLYVHLDRLVGPISTSILISGAAGSLKSTAGMMLIVGMQQRTAGRLAAIIINSKGSDYLFADCARDQWADRLQLYPLSDADRAM